ncbi:MAG: GNAT family N-acetyltransferase [Chloroflexi bacterium]|nr:GNAT family N-acetyltransferase [Chloroflexota bacterium]
MSIEVRRLKEDAEFDAYLQAAIYSFNSARDGSQLERYRQLYDREWCLGAFDKGDLVAGPTIIPFDQHMLGARIPMGGIATVASLPERRRGGAVGALLRAALAEMRDAGQPLSGLYTPHFSLYRRFGWEIAGRMMSYAFGPKTMRTRLPRPDGSFRRVKPDDWRELAALREAFTAPRNGALVRTEQRWRNHVFTEYLRGEHDAVIWSNAADQPRGYAVYTQQHRQSGGPFGETILRVIDWVALDGEGYSALLNYLMTHDLVSQIVLVVSEDEPVLAAFEEPVHVKEPPGAWTGILLRLVDLQRAIECRPSRPEASGLAVTVAVTDVAAPWNTGTWRLECGKGRMAAERTNAAPDLEADATALAPLYNGFANPADAARVGQLVVHDGAAVERMGRMFTTPFRPFCPDDF